MTHFGGCQVPLSSVYARQQKEIRLFQNEFTGRPPVPGYRVRAGRAFLFLAGRRRQLLMARLALSHR